MKNTINFLAGLLLIMAMLGSCVKGEFDAPPIYIPTVDFESNTTIAELKATYNGFRKIEDDVIIKGTVIANDESGNLYKKMVIQDETGGIEITLDKTNTYNQYKVGQRIFVKAKNMYIGDYNNLIQLGYNNNGSIGWLPEVMIADHIFPDSLPGPKPEPRTIALTQLSRDLVSTLVKIDNISFAEAGDVWAVQGVNATNRAINEVPAAQFVVRTSSFANFAFERVPSGTGSITGVLTVFRDTYQLTLRDLDDVGDFSGGGGGGGVPGELNPIDELDENFGAAQENVDINFAGWSNIAEDGNRRWQGKVFGGNGYAQATGFNSNLSSMVTWLITPPVTMNETKYLNFKTAKAFWAHNDNTGLTVWASTDYDGANIAAASWTPVSARVVGQSDPDNTWIESGSIDLSPFMTDDYVFIAFKYRGSGNESTSFRIDDVYIGTDENGGGGGGGGGGGTGGGTFDEPFDIAEAIASQNATPYVNGWISGYIVGTVKDGVNTVASNADLQLTAPFTRATNILLADNPNETDFTKVVAVNLPAGSALRSAVNLVDNPDNLKKQLKVRGVLRTYFGIAGLRDMEGSNDDFELDGNGGGGGGGGQNTIFSENFQGIEVGAGSNVVPVSIPGWTNTAIVGTDLWEGRAFSGDQFAQFSSFYSNNANNEAWLVTPGINLDPYTGEVLTFQTAQAFFTHNALTVYISTNFSGNASDISSATWVDLQPALAGSSTTNYDWVSSGNIDLSSYSGTVHIAFKYVGSKPNNQTGTFRLNNIVITGEDR